METNKKFALCLLALIILCACARAPQEIEEKTLVPLKPEDVNKSIVRVVNSSNIRGVGNGFYVARDKIATNIHLIAGADLISTHVRGVGGTRSIRNVIAFDIKNDLVILKVSGEGVPLSLGNSDAVKTGDSIFDAGILARGSRDKAKHATILAIRDNDKWFSTTLEPDPKVSGGPILNDKNEVIGIEVMESGFGYAIPSNVLKRLLTQPNAAESFAQWQQRAAIRAYSYLEQAKRKFRDDNHTAMIAALNEAITLYPAFATAYTKRGEGKLYLGAFESEQGTMTAAQRHYRSAIDDCDRALQLNPESAAYKNRGLAKRLLADAEAATENASSQRNYNAAIDDYTHVIKQVPNDAASYTGRGTAKRNLGQLESETGNMAAAQRHYHAAIDDYTQAIKRNPDYAKAYHGRGLAKKTLGQQDAAKADLEKAETLKWEQATVRLGWRDNHATGFFVGRNRVAANIHVAGHPDPILVQSVNFERIWYVDGVTAFDAKNDLVILKVRGEGAPLPLGDSDTAGTGESVTVVGYPSGKYSVVKGTVHGIRDSDKWIRIKAKIAGGNSGSPVINTKGQVIGIVFGQQESYGYIIPSNAIKRLLAPSEAIEPLAQWQQRKPVQAIRAQVYVSQARQKLEANNHDEAIADYDKALKLNPEDADTYYNRGLAKLLLGDLEAEQRNTEKARAFYEAGIEDSTQAIKLNPEDFEPYLNRAGGKLRLGQFSENQGNMTKAQQYYQSAIQDYTQSIRLNSEYVDAYINRGTAKVDFGEAKADQGDIAGAQKLYTEAIQDYTQAIQLAPENAYAYNNRGRAKYCLGEFKTAAGNNAEARELYKAAIIDISKSIQLDSENASAYRNRGDIKAALGDFEGAIDDFEKAIETNPEDAEAYYGRGLANKALNRKEAAESDFEKAKNLDPDVGK